MSYEPQRQPERPAAGDNSHDHFVGGIDDGLGMSAQIQGSNGWDHNHS
jgi:hypothetical protein